MIRETMIATLKHENPESIYYLIAAILVIGFVYWIAIHVESSRRCTRTHCSSGGMQYSMS